MDTRRKYLLIDEIISLLSKGKNYVEIAKELNIQRNTVYLLRKSPEYQERVEEVLAESLHRLSLQYSNWLQKSFQTLDRIANSEGKRTRDDSLKASASKSLIDSIFKSMAMMTPVRDVSPASINVSYVFPDEGK